MFSRLLISLMSILLISGCAKETIRQPESGDITENDSEEMVVLPEITFKSMLLKQNDQLILPAEKLLSDEFTLHYEPELDQLQVGDNEVCATITSNFRPEIGSRQCAVVKVIESVMDIDYSLPLETIVTQYLQENNISSDQLMLFYHSNGEELLMNTDTLMLGASTVKVFLNKRYYDFIDQGLIKLEDTLYYNPAYFEMGDGLVTNRYQPGVNIPLRVLLEESIVHSDNTATNILAYNYPKYADNKSFHQELGAYYDGEMDPALYNMNWINGEMMYQVINEVYENQEQYAMLVADMKEALPQRYFKRGIDEVEIAHKYGYYAGYEHDYGIIYTPNTIVAGIFTYNLYNAEIHIQNLSRIFMEYNLANS